MHRPNAGDSDRQSAPQASIESPRDAAGDAASASAYYRMEEGNIAPHNRRTASDRLTRNFHRNQTIEVLPRHHSNSTGLSDKLRRDDRIFRTYTSSELLNIRQHLLEDDRQATPNNNPTTATGALARTATRENASAPSSSSSWRLFYRNLPRTLRFRQNSRSTTRYIDPANAASLRSRLRAKQNEEERREVDESVDNNPPASDFDRQLQQWNQQEATSDVPITDDAKSSQAPLNGAGRTSSLYSADTFVAANDRKAYKIVPINASARPASAVGGLETTEVFASNEVRTSQYTWWSFVPLFLYLTFQKIANLYFLLIGIFQMIPEISPTNGVPLQFLPLSIVTIIDAVFAAYEDYKRHVADDQANSAATCVYNHELKEFEQVQWRDVQVGDFLRVKNHETIPADLLILSVVPAEGSRSNAHNSGICYVETKNLDGETNLKLREAPQATRHMFDNEQDAGEIVSGYLESELPNGDINRYAGTLYLDDEDEDGVGIPISLKNMLLRGSKLRNTNCVYGLVVHTGVDAKIMMSSGDEFPVKVSSIDEMTNHQVGIVVLLLMVMSIAGAIADDIWMKHFRLPSAIDEEALENKSFIGVFVYYFTTLASMVPITLYVSITMVKALQAYFMERDLDLYDEENDVRMTARNMQLNEQLGQISHLFSDKTGTLTCNKMEFRKCSISGTSYGKGTTAIGLAARLRDDFIANPDEQEEESDENDEELVMQCPAPNVNFQDKRLWRDLAENSEQSLRIREFFTHLALCHGVLIERLHEIPEGMTEPPIAYSASSPDEQALVCGAKYFGFEFVEREPGSVTLKTPEGVLEQYDVLEVFEFDSTRKRMTVVVQKRKTDAELMTMGDDDEEENDVLVLCKGADSVLFPRLADSDINSRIQTTTLQHLETFARDGLRTLVICAKKLTWKEWEAFHVKYRSAMSDLHQVELRSRNEPNTIDNLQNEMEQQLELLGATAIEDRLQDGVPETMEQLAKAGISIWVLTGDMEETAINIGYACRLLNNDMQRHVLNAATFHSKGSILRQLDKIFHRIRQPNDQCEHALVMDGASLSWILEDPLYNLHLLRVALLCKVVIACRVSPQQKAQLVELVKVNVPESHTLAIGDGANDVPMIQSAHIGIGISGQEGMQAVNSSDYAIGQFRFLRILLLVHGRWNYNRIAMLTVYTFYKNIVYCVSLFWYMLGMSAYSGSMVYSAFIQQGYNLFFTAAPIMVYAVFDRDVPKETAATFPLLYHPQTRVQRMFTYKMFWKWIAVAVVDSIGVFYIMLAAADNVMPYSETVDFTVLGSVGWTILCVVVNARFCLLVHTWDAFEVVALVLSMVVVYLFQYLTDKVQWSSPDYDTYSFPWIFNQPEYWLGQLLGIVAIVFKHLYYDGCRQRFQPEYLDLVRETIGKPALQQQLQQCKPPVSAGASPFLHDDLVHMMDYKERREQERLPVRYNAPGRAQLYRGFAFDQPACLMNWILATGRNTMMGNGSHWRSKAVNAHVRQLILQSDDPVIFENERYQPFCGFGSTYPGYLLPTDRSRWSDRSGKLSAMCIPLAGLELNFNVPGCDEEGWVYETDFKFFPSTVQDANDRPSKPSRGRHGRLVRRREWILAPKQQTEASDDTDQVGPVDTSVVVIELSQTDQKKDQQEQQV